jgi:hypothetical protein
MEHGHQSGKHPVRSASGDDIRFANVHIFLHRQRESQSQFYLVVHQVATPRRGLEPMVIGPGNSRTLQPKHSDFGPYIESHSQQMPDASADIQATPS